MNWKTYKTELLRNKEVRDEYEKSRNQKGKIIIVWFAFVFETVVITAFCWFVAKYKGSNFEGFIQLGSAMNYLYYLALGLSAVSFGRVLLGLQKLREENVGNKRGAYLMLLAIGNAIPVFGVVVFLLTGDIGKVLLFSGLGLATLFFLYPREG